MNTTEATKPTITKLALYYLTFLATCICSIYFQKMIIVDDNAPSSIFIGLFSRFLIWTLPVLLLVDKPFDYLKLKQNVVKGIGAGTIIGIAFCIIRALVLYWLKGSVGLNLDIANHLWWEVIIFVGLSEEVVFRGYLLQQIESISNFWIGNIVSTLIFALHHIPYFILIYNYGIMDIAHHSLSILWLSLFFGFVFKKTESLWACIIMHSFNNFVSIAIR
jgi:hypothetical protein